MEKYLFFTSSGIKSAFGRHLFIPRYSSSEMLTIFKLRTKKEGWKMEDGALYENFFVKNMDVFPAYGRDISSLFLACKVSHGERVFTLARASTKRELVAGDIIAGLAKYKDLKKKDRKTTLTYFG